MSKISGVKYYTYEVWYCNELVEKIQATSIGSVLDSYRAENNSETAFGRPKKWVIGWLEIKLIEQ